MAAALNLALNWIFIPRYGFVAAGCTTCFSYFALMTVHYFITTKIMKIKLYHNRFMYLSLAGVCAGAGGFVCLYPYTGRPIRFCGTFDGSLRVPQQSVAVEYSAQEEKGG